MKKILSAVIILIVFTKCSSYSFYELYLAPCKKLHLEYLPDRFAIAATDGKLVDTSVYYSMNFLQYLQKMRECEGVIPPHVDLGQFRKSNFCYLPDTKSEFMKLKNAPDSVFMDNSYPSVCDCDYANLQLPDSLKKACLEKFQLHLYLTNTLQEEKEKFDYYLDLCKGKLSDTITFNQYQKENRDYYTNYSSQKNAEARKKDSADNTGPNVRCSYREKVYDATGQQRRYYQQCPKFTTHKSGKCQVH